MNRRSFLYSALSSLAFPGIAEARGHNYFCKWRDDKGIFIPEQHIIVQSTDLSTYGALREAAFATAQPQTVLVEKLQGYKLALADIRDGRLPPDSVAVFDNSRSPERSIEALNKKLAKIVIYHNVPESFEEAQRVHGQRFFAEGKQTGRSDEDISNALASFQKYAAAFNDLGARKIVPQRGQDAASALEEDLSTYSSNDLIVIVSHLAKYEIIKLNTINRPFAYPAALLPLTDGSVYKPDIPTKGGPIVWLVGCETWDLFTGSFDLDSPVLSFGQQLSYLDALKIVRVIRGGTSPRQILWKIQTKQWQLREPRLLTVPPQDKGHPNIMRPNSPALIASIYEGNVLVLSGKVA